MLINSCWGYAIHLWPRAGIWNRCRANPDCAANVRSTGTQIIGSWRIAVETWATRCCEVARPPDFTDVPLELAVLELEDVPPVTRSQAPTFRRYGFCCADLSIRRAAIAILTRSVKLKAKPAGAGGESRTRIWLLVRHGLEAVYQPPLPWSLAGRFSVAVALRDVNPPLRQCPACALTSAVGTGLLAFPLAFAVATHG